MMVRRRALGEKIVNGRVKKLVEIDYKLLKKTYKLS